MIVTSDVPSERRGGINFSFSCSNPGIFDVNVAYKFKNITSMQVFFFFFFFFLIYFLLFIYLYSIDFPSFPFSLSPKKKQLKLDDLLEMQHNNQVEFETDFLKLNVNLLIYLLNKHFMT